MTFGTTDLGKKKNKDQGSGTESVEGLGHRQNGEARGGEGWTEWCAPVHGCILPEFKLNPRQFRLITSLLSACVCDTKCSSIFY